MKASIVTSIILMASLGFSGIAVANCADDAVNTCNNKHPNPNKSDHAYELYELCLKAQLSQKCPSNASVDPFIKGQVVKPETAKWAAKSERRPVIRAAQAR